MLLGTLALCLELGVVLEIGVSMALIFTIIVLPIFLKDKKDFE